MKNQYLSKKLDVIFHEVLPQHGYTVRDNQVELSLHMLDTMQNGGIALCEAGVGTGKTHAYIMAAILHMSENPHFTRIRQSYPRDADYYKTTKMPVVISTSSIELQRAITQEYIPEISKMLTKHQIISEPLAYVVRKGKEHYICDRRLDAYAASIKRDMDMRIYSQIKRLAAGDVHSIDLDALQLQQYVKNRINVPVWCNNQCPLHGRCRFMRLQEHQKQNTHHFQVCNHNYFFADLIKRKNNLNPLLPNYQSVIFDEAHKLLDAARQIYGFTLSDTGIGRLLDEYLRFCIRNNRNSKAAATASGEAVKINKALFQAFLTGTAANDAERIPVEIAGNIRIKTAILLNKLKDLRDMLLNGTFSQNGSHLYVRQSLNSLIEHLDSLITSNDYILWLEPPVTSGGAATLNAIPKRLDKMLHRDLWMKPVPAILTSGTLSAAGSFDHFKKGLGMQLLVLNRTTEIVQQSPFDYKRNCLIYLAGDLPFPDPKDGKYIDAVADHIGRLINATHGHTLALFTSYRVMEFVCRKLKDTIPFPLMRISRGVLGALAQFEKSGNGVLFAAGSCWEGVNLPGDVLSSLIIVKLPFPTPDPLSDYEQTLYDSRGEYVEQALLPEMLVKLKQGAGRLIRNETDTGVISILDSRLNGRYREPVINALPKCPVTGRIEDVARFIRQRKKKEYFIGG